MGAHQTNACTHRTPTNKLKRAEFIVTLRLLLLVTLCHIQWRASCLFSRFAFICIPNFHIDIDHHINTECILFAIATWMAIVANGARKHTATHAQYWSILSDSLPYFIGHTNVHNEKRIYFMHFIAPIYWDWPCAGVSEHLHGVHVIVVDRVCCNLILNGLTTSQRPLK